VSLKEAGLIEPFDTLAINGVIHTALWHIGTAVPPTSINTKYHMW
jgi:hypothetical protein